MIHHLEQQCLALTARDKKTNMKDVNLLWDRDDDIETYFVKANKLEEDLQENYCIKWPTIMKITQAEDEVNQTNIFSKEELMSWEEKTRADKTWVHIKRTSRTDGPQQYAFKAILPTRMGLRLLPARKNREVCRQDA